MIDTAKVKITIDKEFSALIPAMAAHEREQLEKNLVADGGCREPITLWDFNGKLILLDGHNRYEICKRRGLGHSFKRKKFFDRNAARNWVIENALGRRNITDEQRRYLLGKLWQETAKSDGGRPKTTATVAEVLEAPVTAETIAAEHGVSERTVHNAAEFAKTIDTIGEKSPELKAAILSGEVQASSSDLEAIAEAPKRKVESVAKKVAAGDKKAVKDAAAAEVKSQEEKPATDPNGLEIPKRLQPIFEAQPKFRSIVQQLGRIQSEIDELRKTEAGAFLNEAFERIKTDIGNAQREVKFATPHQICPYCKGKGCKRTGSAKTPCRENGWTVKGVKGAGE